MNKNFMNFFYCYRVISIRNFLDLKSICVELNVFSYQKFSEIFGRNSNQHYRIIIGWLFIVLYLCYPSIYALANLAAVSLTSSMLPAI